MKAPILYHLRRLVALPLLVALLLWPLTSEAASSLPGSTNFPAVAAGQAYAGYLRSSDLRVIASVGPLFPVGLSCATSDRTARATAAGLQIDNFVTGGALVDETSSTFSTTSATIHSGSTIQNLNAFGGAISAKSIQAMASSSGDASGATSSGSVTLTNLVIDGQAIAAHPAPNTKITLAGIGTVTLNAESHESDGATTAISVEAIRVDISVAGNAFGLPVGSKLILAAVETSLQTLASPHTVGALSYGLEATGLAGPGKVQSGPWARAAIGCGGGDATTKLAGVTVPSVGSVGAIVDTASGQVTSSGGRADATSTVQQVSLLGGLVVATSVSSRASASFDLTGSTSGQTTLENAQILGLPVSVHPAPNTTIDLPLLGRIVLNEQTSTIGATRSTMTVNALHIYVTHANSLGLPVGAEIIVAHSQAHAEKI